MSIASSILAARSGNFAYSVSIAGSLGVPLTRDQCVPNLIILTGAITANILVTMDVPVGDAGAEWDVVNATTGAFTVTLQAALGGGTVVIGQGKAGHIRWDGSSLFALETDTALGGAASSGSNSNITALTGITGGIVGTGSIQFDKLMGNLAPLGIGRLAKAFPSDANYTASAAEAANQWIDVSGTIGAQRDFVLPLTPNATTACVYFVTNSTVGGFGVRFIGPSGTGVVVANGETAIIGCDSVNYRRVTLNSP
jgi:hypothetical protein